MENKGLASVFGIIVIVGVAVANIFGIAAILAFAPLVLVFVAALAVGKASGKYKQDKYSGAITKPVVPTSMHDMYQYQSTCKTSNSNDDFCHNQHQADRLIPDDARSELEELKSLLDSGLMERPEYNDRVRAIRINR